jgi:hypothetical protein
MKSILRGTLSVYLSAFAQFINYAHFRHFNCNIDITMETLKSNSCCFKFFVKLVIALCYFCFDSVFDLFSLVRLCYVFYLIIQRRLAFVYVLCFKHFLYFSMSPIFGS